MRIKKWPLLLLFLSAIARGENVTAGAGSLTPASEKTAVVPIDWSTFNARLPADEQFIRLVAILQNADKYAVTTWWQKAKAYAAEDGAEYLKFEAKKGPPAETEIRPPADEALALAISFKLHLYNPEVAGVSEKIAEAQALRLIKSVAHAHKINSEKGWGDQWQSALWAGTCGEAAWLLWDKLPTADQEQVRRMVEYEANRFLTYNVPYYQDKTGKIITKGDTKSEENAWNAFDLSVACCMMPHHPNWQKWSDKNLEMMISAYARPSDVTRPDIINGKPLTEWLNGSNSNEDGTLVNHNRIHPDYMVAGPFENCPYALNFLARKPLPAGTFFNAQITYHALTDLNFTPGTTPYPVGGPIQPPGGTIYDKSTSTVYTPQGNDWGATRQMNYLLADTLADVLHLDSLSTVKAPYWAALHAKAALAMQSRFDDGRTYGDKTEDKFHAREEWVAARAAECCLIKWVAFHGGVTITNDGISEKNSAPANH